MVGPCETSPPPVGPCEAPPPLGPCEIAPPVGLLTTPVLVLVTAGAGRLGADLGAGADLTCAAGLEGAGAFSVFFWSPQASVEKISRTKSTVEFFRILLFGMFSLLMISCSSEPFLCDFTGQAASLTSKSSPHPVQGPEFVVGSTMRHTFALVVINSMTKSYHCPELETRTCARICVEKCGRNRGQDVRKDPTRDTYPISTVGRPSTMVPP